MTKATDVHGRTPTVPGTVTIRVGSYVKTRSLNATGRDDQDELNPVVAAAGTVRVRP